MKKLFPLIILFFSLKTYSSSPDIPIIPYPASAMEQNGAFVLDSSTSIFAPPVMQKVVSMFNDYMYKQYGFRLKVADQKSPVAQIVIRMSKMPGTESYMMNVEPSIIFINTPSVAGALYAMETLKQLIPPAKELKRISIPCISINDAPRFTYRGMHLDVVRHFYPKEVVKQYLDWMLMYKMNTFHWHLTDDQGWRIEIKKYPLLTSVGGYRNGTLIGHYGDVPQRFDSVRYGGFYTQDDIREIVQYAADRNITIIPEIEMPGHATAALSAYPEYACNHPKLEPGKTWGVYNDIFCPTEQTFTFLQNILSEVCELFPGTYIHLGGDEVPKDRWKESAFCQKLMKEKGLKDEEELQHYFTNRMMSFLRTKNKIGIGWDEIQNPGLDSSAVVMSWRGNIGGLEAAKAGHDVIMAPYTHVYFDYYQTRNTNGKVAIGGYLPVSEVYKFEPIPAELTPEQAVHILGGQACVWTEYIADVNRLQEMIFPRMSALSEVLWSPVKERDFSLFSMRMIAHMKYLRFRSIGFSSALLDLQSRTSADENGNVSVELFTKEGFGAIHYTLDGTSPDVNSPVYFGKIKAEQSLMLKAVVMNGSIPVSEEFSKVFRINRATGKEIKLENQPSASYNTGGAFSLVDGSTGRIPWLGDEWLGFQDTNMVALIDLGKEQTIGRVSLDVLSSPSSGIYLPKSVSVSISPDNVTWTEMKTISTEKADPSNRELRIDFPYTKARFVRVTAVNGGGYVFVDEISVD